ncbi:hypothetical protein A9Q99_04935 [Gammaproteobacteria bacterium 45_16_T64]|nr:hypothetical protein A9Q99_04935 [Gammaproteobacteria bacterium 45_16_T64]
MSESMEATDAIAGLKPTQVQATNVAQKETSKDQLQTCSPPQEQLMVIPTARRLASPISALQTFASIERRRDINPSAEEVYDEELTQRRLGWYQQLTYTEQSLRPGWLYLLKEGRIWREYQVRNSLFSENEPVSGEDIDLNHSVTFFEVPLDLYSDDAPQDTRPASLSGVPYILMPVEEEVELAWSEVQWGWSRFEAMADATLRTKRCTTVSLACAQGNDDKAVQCFSSETYQLYADESIPQRIREQAPGLFAVECDVQPVKHVIEVVLDDVLEIGRELANRYQRAISSHENLLMELKNPENTGDYPSGEPVHERYRFARWFDSALLVYQQFFMAQSDEDKGLLDKKHDLYRYRAELDIKDIYIALGMESRSLVRKYTEQCQRHLINFIRGDYEAEGAVSTDNVAGLEVIHSHLADYRSLPGLAEVFIDADGHPLEPVESDDLLYLAKIFHRLGDVPRMKDITIDGNRMQYLSEKSAAEQAGCTLLLAELSGENEGNLWYQYICDRPVTNEEGEDQSTVGGTSEFQVSRRLGQLFTSIISELIGPHVNPDRTRIISTKDRLLNLLLGKLELNHKITLDKIANIDGLGFSKDTILQSSERKTYLLSQVVRPDFVQYPEKENIQPAKDQLARVKQQKLELLTNTYDRTRPQVIAELKAQQRRLLIEAMTKADKAKAAALAKVSSAQEDLTALSAVRKRQDVIHRQTVTRIDGALADLGGELSKVRVEIEGANTELQKSEVQMKKSVEDTEWVDRNIKRITEGYDSKIGYVEIKVGGGRVLSGFSSVLPDWVPGKEWVKSQADAAEAELKNLVAAKKDHIESEVQKRDQLNAERPALRDAINGQRSRLGHLQVLQTAAEKKQAALEGKKKHAQIYNAKNVEAMNAHEKSLESEKNSAKASRAQTIKNSKADISNARNQGKQNVEAKLKGFDEDYRSGVDAIKSDHKALIRDVEERSYQKHLEAVVHAKAEARESGKRFYDPSNSSDVAQKTTLNDISAGRYTPDNIITTNTAAEFEAERANKRPDTIVLTPTESELWNDLIEKQVHVVVMNGAEDKVSEKYIIHRQAAESMLAHKERIAGFGNALLVFEIMNAVHLWSKLEDGELLNPDSRNFWNFVGSIFDTGDALAAVAHTFMERRLVLASLASSGVSSAGATAASQRVAEARQYSHLAGKVAVGFMCIANFYSAYWCFHDYQSRSLANDDANIAFALQGIGFTFSGVGGLLIAADLLGFVALGGVAASVLPIVGLAILVAGTIAYYFYYTEDLPVLDMWLEHGPFSSDDESLINYAGSRHRFRIFDVTILDAGQSNSGIYSFFDKTMGMFFMPSVVLDTLNPGENVIVLKKNSKYSRSSIWIHPKTFQLLAVNYSEPYTAEKANSGYQKLLAKGEGDSPIFLVGDSALGRIGDTVGGGDVPVGDVGSLLTYLTPDIERNTERFEEPSDASQMLKVNPAEWEKDGALCYSALKAALYPVEISMSVSEARVIDMADRSIMPRPEDIAYATYMGKTKQPVGNIVTINLTIPGDIPSDYTISLMLVRIDNNVFSGGSYVMKHVLFSLDDRNQLTDSGGVVIKQIEIDSDGMGNNVEIMINIDRVDCRDKRGMIDGVFDIGNNIDINAWVQVLKPVDSESSRDGAIIRPYVTKENESAIRRYIAEFQNKSNELNLISDVAGVGFYSLAELIKHDMKLVDI